MEQKNKDFLLFYDWYKIIKNMSHKHAHMLIIAMVEYQANGVEPPEFPEKIRDVATLMFDQLRRRMENQVNGRKGGEVRARALAGRDVKELSFADDMFEPSSMAALGLRGAFGGGFGGADDEASSGLYAPPDTQRQDKNKTKQDSFYRVRPDAPDQVRPAERGERGRGYGVYGRSAACRPSAASSTVDDGFFEEAVRHSLEQCEKIISGQSD